MQTVKDNGTYSKAKCRWFPFHKESEVLNGTLAPHGLKFQSVFLLLISLLLCHASSIRQLTSMFKGVNIRRLLIVGEFMWSIVNWLCAVDYKLHCSQSRRCSVTKLLIFEVAFTIPNKTIWRIYMHTYILRGNERVMIAWDVSILNFCPQPKIRVQYLFYFLLSLSYSSCGSDHLIERENEGSIHTTFNGKTFTSHCFITRLNRWPSEPVPMKHDVHDSSLL